MSLWPRLIVGIALISAVVASPALVAAQGSPTQRAKQLSDEGKELFAEKKYYEASKKFKAATVLSPNPKYYFNLCFTLNYVERYRDAITACEAAKANRPTQDLATKIDRVLVALRKKVPQDPTPPPVNPDPADPNNPDPNNPDPNNPDPNNPDPNNPDPNNPDPNNPDPNNPDPNNPDPNNPDPNNNGTPADDPFAVVENVNKNDYKWAFGGSIGAAANLGFGNSFTDFAGGGPTFNLWANFILSEQSGFGFQGFLGFTNFAAQSMFSEQLNLVDVGGALFKHIALRKNLYVTPLVGLMASIQTVGGTSESFIAPGLRAEAKLSMLFGSREQHELSLTPALNVYGKASDAEATLDPEGAGLDDASATFTVSVGYTVRFDTPFGSTPLISLE